MKLFYYYRNAVMYPALLAVLFVAVYSFLSNRHIDGTEAMPPVSMALIMSLFYVLLMMILSSTIFLNGIKSLKSSLVWNVVTWFLLPLGYIVFVLYRDIGNRLHFGFGFESGFVFVIIVTTPFVYGLISTFISYRKSKQYEVK